MLCGVHWADADAAAASPAGRIVLARCPECAYVRNVAFDPELMVYDTTMDTNLHSLAGVPGVLRRARATTSRTATTGRATVLDIGCGQGEFLRELCHDGGVHRHRLRRHVRRPGRPRPVRGDVPQRTRPARRGAADFDFVTSRHWFEHLDDPYEFLADLRAQAGDRPVYGYIEVPDAGYDLATAGWEVIYPHVSYFDAFPLRHHRAGRLAGRGQRHTVLRACSATSSSRRTHRRRRWGGAPAERRGPRPAARATGGFGARHHAERDAWRGRIAELVATAPVRCSGVPASGGVQFLTFADTDHHLAAVVDVNPRKWGRYLPVTAHRVDPPDSLTELQPRAVIITNPAYRDEVGTALTELGVSAEVLVA